MSTYTSGVAVVVEGHGIAILYSGLFRKIAAGASVYPLDDEAIRLSVVRGRSRQTPPRPYTSMATRDYTERAGA